MIDRAFILTSRRLLSWNFAVLLTIAVTVLCSFSSTTTPATLAFVSTTTFQHLTTIISRRRDNTSNPALFVSLKPAAIPLMDSGKALARSGELLIEMTQSMQLYGGGLSAAGAQIRNAGDCLAQAAASCRFKTGTELVIDELREAATCLQEAKDKCVLAKEEAQLDQDISLQEQLVNMVGPLAATSQGLEKAGAGILQKQPLVTIGLTFVETSEYIEQVASCIEDIASSTTTIEPIESGIISAQRMKYASEKLKEAGIELKGEIKPKPKGKAWLKGM